MSKLRPEISVEVLNERGGEYLPGYLGIEMCELAENTLSSRMPVRQLHIAPNEFLHAASVVALALDGPPRPGPYVIRPDASGALSLGVESCEIETRFGQRAKKENFLGHVFLTRWTRAEDVPTWMVSAPRAGRYKVEISYGAGGGAKGAEISVVAGANVTRGIVQPTGGDWVFKTFPAGELDLAAGEQALQVKGRNISLERVVLRPM